MDAPYSIIVDSPCEITKEFAEQNDLTVLHFTYTEADKEDGGLSGTDNLFNAKTAHEFYDAMRHGASPMTSQPSQLEFKECFRQVAKSGKPAIYLAFDSGISGCYEGACTALERVKEDYPDIPLTIVDTKLASTPLNLLVYEAVRQRNKGLSMEGLAQWATEAHNFIHTLFMVDDLKALARGGRIPTGIAFVGTKLDIKPMLTIALDGKLELVGVARGRKKGIRRLADNYLKNHEENTPVCAIGNADCPADVRRLEDLISRSDENTLFLESFAGPTIGCHVGPGFMSCCFWGADKRGTMAVPDKIASQVEHE